jgi:hypothetical protein
MAASTLSTLRPPKVACQLRFIFGRNSGRVACLEVLLHTDMDIRTRLARCGSWDRALPRSESLMEDLQASMSWPCQEAEAYWKSRFRE